jgi:putative acetyltransferase
LDIQLVEVGDMPMWQDFETLVREYALELDVDLCFQGFYKGLATLSVMYGPPSGGAWVGTIDGQMAGCVGLRTVSSGVGELKRPYVRDIARGGGLGRTFAQTAIDHASSTGIMSVVLDTLPLMAAARG